jgi:hypothetical protein
MPMAHGQATLDIESCSLGGGRGGGCEPYRHNHAWWSQFLIVALGIFECGKVIRGFNNFMLE